MKRLEQEVGVEGCVVRKMQPWSWVVKSDCSLLLSLDE
jgi:hypothetical protein